MSAVTVVGAPSYTSGTHMWKGTLPILKPKPTSSSPSATASVPDSRAGDASAAAMPAKFAVPVTP